MSRTPDQAESPRSDAPFPSRTASAVFGCLGPRLTADEAAFFRDAAPYGFILFARNVESPEQIGRLTEDLREAVGWRAPILIDQEGGRVARLRAPHWREWVSVGVLAARADAGEIAESDLAEVLRLRFRLIAEELNEIGVDVDCMPLLDVRQEGAHDIIGDRALGAEPARVAARGRAVADGLMTGGVLPVIKHLPGHGRAGADSHLALPRVETPRAELEAVDLPPFRLLADLPFAMTAHIVYDAFDPERCATVSETVVRDVIRGAIGFDGALMTDDLSMKALSGGFEARARDSLAAGCDLILHCNGDPQEMTQAMAGCRALEGAAHARCARAAAARRLPDPFDRDAALARLKDLDAGPR